MNRNIVKKKYLLSCLVMILWSNFIFGKNDSLKILGAFETAKQAHEEFFIPGIVQHTLIQGQSFYVICVSTQKDFAEESDALLFQELELSAKYLLLIHLSNNQPEKFEITMKNFSSMYQWQEGQTYFANYSVQTEHVNVQEKASPVPEKTPTVKEQHHHEPSSVTPSFPDQTKPIDEKMKYKVLVESGIELDVTLPKLADLYFAENDYEAAIVYYEQFLSLFQEKTAERETIFYQLAVCWDKLENIENALNTYEAFRKEFPFSSRNSDVLTRMNTLKIKQVTDNPKYKRSIK